MALSPVPARFLANDPTSSSNHVLITLHPVPINQELQVGWSNCICTIILIMKYISFLEIVKFNVKITTNSYITV